MAIQDTSCEPMDIDISTHSASNNSFTERPPTVKSPLLIENDGDRDNLSSSKETDCPEFKPEVWSIKKYHIVRQTEKSTLSSIQLLILAIIVLLLSLIAYCISDIRCSNDIDLKNLKVKLINRLYGQTQAIENLIEGLGSSDKSKILFFYGGTGVGKTMTSSLTFEDVWNCSNVYHYTMPSFGNTFSTEIMLGLNICENSIVVVDDLKYKDFYVKEHIVEVIKKSEDLNRKVTVILIYNCDIISKDFVKKCDNTFYSDLSLAFEDIKVYKKFIEFKPLTQDVLRLCIEDELGDNIVSDIHLNNLLNNFNVALDGCKGVHKKVKFLNMQ